MGMPNSLWKTDSIPRSKPNSCKIEMRTGLTWTKSSSHGWIVITWSPHPYRDTLDKSRNNQISNSINCKEMDKQKQLFKRSHIGENNATWIQHSSTMKGITVSYVFSSTLSKGNSCSALMWGIKEVQHTSLFSSVLWITSKIIPSRAMALLASSTVLISTNANFFSWLM